MNLGSGYLIAVLSAVLFGASPAFAAYAQAHGVTPATLALASAIAMLLSGLPGYFRDGIIPPRSALVPTLLLAPIYAAFVYSYQVSLSLIPAPLAIIVLFTHPILVTLWRGMMSGERLGWYVWAGNVLALSGVIVAAQGDIGAGAWIGGVVLASFASILSAATILLSAEILERGGSVVHAQAGLGSAMFLLLPVIMKDGIPVLPVGVAAWGGILGCSFAIGIGLILFLAAMRRLGPIRAALISNIEPIVGFGMAWAIAGASITPALVLGSSMVIVAVIDWRALLRGRNSLRAPAD